MKRRLTLARALVNDPDLIFMDEPTTGLDPQARHLIWERLKQLLARGKTILLTTHFMDEAERLADRLAVIDRGRMIAEGAPRELIARAHRAAGASRSTATVRASGRSASAAAWRPRIEVTGETVFCYAHEPAPALHSLEATSGTALPAPSRQSRGSLPQADGPRDAGRIVSAAAAGCFGPELGLGAAAAVTGASCPVWRRNFLVWRKLFVERLLTNVVEPLLTIAAFGYGLGSLLPQVDGVSYLQFLASGSIAMSVMYSAKFEVALGAFSRMHVQKTWDAILHTPLAVDDLLLGEIVWAASKATFTAFCILVMIWLLDIAREPLSLLVLPAAFFIALVFAAMALIVNAVARSYDLLSNYFTVVVMPLVFLSGVYFPLTQLPGLAARGSPSGSR